MKRPAHGGPTHNLAGVIERPRRVPATARRRPRWWALTAVILVAVLAASTTWFLLARPPLRDGEVYGVDVSNHQGPIDWPALAADDITFAYIKASEGGDFTDASFTRNWAGTEAAGVQRGAYHFFTLCRPGAEQAEHFLRTAPPQDEVLPPAVDLELDGNCSQRPDPEAVYAELDTFLAAVEAAWGRDVVLYVGEDWEGLYPVLDRSQRPRWLVSFVGRPDRQWTVWQFSWWGRVDGVDGRVDLDVGRLAGL